MKFYHPSRQLINIMALHFLQNNICFHGCLSSSCMLILGQRYALKQSNNFFGSDFDRIRTASKCLEVLSQKSSVCDSLEIHSSLLLALPKQSLATGSSSPCNYAFFMLNNCAVITKNNKNSNCQLSLIRKTFKLQLDYRNF